MKNASREGSWRLKRPKLHAKSAKRKARKAKEAPKMTKLIPQMVPRPPQDASFGSLGSDFEVFFRRKISLELEIVDLAQTLKTQRFFSDFHGFEDMRKQGK